MHSPASPAPRFKNHAPVAASRSRSSACFSSLSPSHHCCMILGICLLVAGRLDPRPCARPWPLRGRVPAVNKSAPNLNGPATRAHAREEVDTRTNDGQGVGGTRLMVAIGSGSVWVRDLWGVRVRGRSRWATPAALALRTDTDTGPNDQPGGDQPTSHGLLWSIRHRAGRACRPPRADSCNRSSSPLSSLLPSCPALPWCALAFDLSLRVLLRSCTAPPHAAPCQ